MRAYGCGATTPDLLTIAEAAERLGVSEGTIRRRIADGLIDVFRDGRIIRIPEAALAAYVDRHTSRRARAEVLGFDRPRRRRRTRL